jgi:hypothetical protein
MATVLASASFDRKHGLTTRPEGLGAAQGTAR